MPSLPFAPSLSLRVIAPIVAALTFYSVFLSNPAVLQDPDTYWHIAAGEWILSHGYVPHVDVFSHSKAGAPWQAHEWLSEVFMALAYRAGGWSGVVILFGLAAAAVAALLTTRVARSLGGLALLTTVIVALGATSRSLLTRPHMFMLPILVLWVSRLIAARDAGRAPPLWLALLMTLWANLHGSYVFGFLLAGFFGLEALVDAKAAERLKVVRDWGIFGAACLIAAMITPHGPMGLVFPFKVMSMESLKGITEWLPTSFAQPGPFELGLLLVLFVSLTRPVKLHPVRALLLLVLLHMALQHTRHLIVLSITAPIILAAPLAAAFGQSKHKPVDARLPALVFAVAALVLAGVRLAYPLTRVDDRNTPKTALQQVPAALRAQPVFNDYDFGGYLIFNGIKVFIDGRADMYGDAFVTPYFRLARGGDPAALAKALSEHKIAWTIFKPGEPLARAMDNQPGWRRSYADRYAVVHVRQDALPSPAPQ